MASPSAGSLETRIQELEQQLQELRLRIVALERLVGASGPHRGDETTVREKVTYDWQA
jgi:hypothetical protein